MKMFNKPAKPIFVCTVPVTYTKERVNALYNELSFKLKDYHVLVYRDNTLKTVKFECFNCEINKIEFEELKQKLYKTINLEQ
jgi:hypothetical protein